MKVARIGVVGLGIGAANADAIARSPHGRVVALCDLDEGRMQRLAEKLPQPVKLFTDYRKLCRDGEVDGVFVGTPNQLHVPVAMAAVRHDKHVLVTKPLADSARAARRLVEAAESAGVVNMMSLSIRYSGQVQYLGALHRDGEFGTIYYGRARSIRRSGIPDWSLGFIEEGGGAFRDMGVHVLDSAWWIMGMPRPVSVTGVAGAVLGPRGQGYWRYRTPPRKYSRRFAADDYAGGFIRFDGGAGLQVESFWASHQADEIQIELFGTEAGAKWNPLTLYRTVKGAPHDTAVKVPEGPTPWERIAEHFLACIVDDVKCQAPLRHGLIVQEILEALLKSARTGREVRLG